jgi:hypothetical protein
MSRRRYCADITMQGKTCEYLAKHRLEQFISLAAPDVILLSNTISSSLKLRLANGFHC